MQTRAVVSPFFSQIGVKPYTLLYFGYEAHTYEHAALYRKANGARLPDMDHGLLGKH